MATDYAAIRIDNERKYGTDIGRIGPMLLANNYADRTHFIFELLQNAEDALARRHGWNDRRAVEFTLSAPALRVSHFGTPFTDADVRGICGIAESTKDLTAIGRFGIGFKSVYAFTDCPEIHSGDEHFAIESFVWPKAIPAIETRPGETVLRLPLREDDPSAMVEIASGLQRLGPRTLLFLREIQEISWSVAGGPSGLYLRGKAESLSNNACKVVVIGEDHATDGVTEETWLVFSREVSTSDGVKVGFAELAFQLEDGGSGGGPTVRAVTDSPLVVFFPTILSTNLGFLVQGPYRTTPSRDNVPSHDPWNKHLVKETATLLVETLQELRSLGLLNVAALRSLPLDASRFPAGSMFAPLFTAVREALSTKCLLPRFGRFHVAARRAKLARTQDLRELLSPSQLKALFQTDRAVHWLSEEITQERTPELRRYLMNELKIAEIVPDALLPMLTKPFLEAQTDKWIVLLYEFLHDQPALLRSVRLNNIIPLIRLEDGTHLTVRKGDQPQAFLPGAISTGFPTVRRSVCRTEKAVASLKALGLTEPDPVDDVIANILPKYPRPLQVGDAEYEADIERLVAAFSTDSTAQRQKLAVALRSANFVLAMDAPNGTQDFVRPTEAYQATQRIKELFDGVPGVLIVDDSVDCLRGERIRNLLEASGAPLYLLPVGAASVFTPQQLFEMRKGAGCENITSEQSIDDYTLRGLGELLPVLCQLPEDAAHARATLLWEALCDVVERRGAGAFLGEYRWFWYTDRQARFDAAFVRQLNETDWVPGPKGALERPEFVVFETLGWKPNPFLQSKIRFKPPIIETLAREAGIEPGVLDLLKKLGLTNEAELRSKLGLPETEPTQPERDPGPRSVEDALKALLGGAAPAPKPPVPDPSGTEPQGSRGTGGGRSDNGTGQGAGGGRGMGVGSSDGKSGREPSASSAGAKRTAGVQGGRPFISYVGAHPNDEEPDPEGLDQAARMALEENAIALILKSEPQLQRTPTHNPGFDLSEPGADGQTARWVEVKAMKGTLHDRPVGLSSKQFEFAQQHGEAYWLYVVERADSPEQARIVQIQDPAGKAQTFTFDHGWAAVADIIELAGFQQQD